jgi:hypothetical protein
VRAHGVREHEVTGLLDQDGNAMVAQQRQVLGFEDLVSMHQRVRAEGGFATLKFGNIGLERLDVALKRSRMVRRNRKPREKRNIYEKKQQTKENNQKK